LYYQSLRIYSDDTSAQSSGNLQNFCHLPIIKCIQEKGRGIFTTKFGVFHTKQTDSSFGMIRNR
ncbi:MAG: hypothetical protein ACKO4S_17665, partial [Snowella sp.]